jgi:predicted dehydrogenase
MPEKMKIGIVGMGAIGNVHADAYKATGAADIAAICDVDPVKLSSSGERLGVKTRFADYRELVGEHIDAVLVCVGNTLHREVAIAALRAGKHVFLEKPMAMNAKEAQEIASAARRARRVLQMGMVWRQNATAKVVREYVKDGLLGEIYHIRAVILRRRGIPGLGGWFTTKAQSGGGPMIDIGVHWFDLSMWLSGLWKPTRVSAMTYAKFGPRMAEYRYVGMWAGPPKLDGKFDVEDYSTGFVRFGNKATMSFEVSWAGNTDDEGFVEVIGDKGGAKVMSDGKPVRILTEHNNRPADITPQYNVNANGFQGQAQAFAAACRGECPPAATAEEGVTVMKLIDAIYASSAANKEVEVV